jgi:uncharacterized membrane protein YgaE (UPF0421/DUF939 family)
MNNSNKRKKGDFDNFNNSDNYEKLLIDKIENLELDINLNSANLMEFAKSGGLTQTISNNIAKKFKKIDEKLDSIDKIYKKLDYIQTILERSLIEKDYVIENLRTENTDLKKELISNISLNKDNDYFY